MAQRREFEHEWREIEKIDFLLHELVQAVESGELHKASYDLMAPRYLLLRKRFVDVIEAAQPPRAPSVWEQELAPPPVTPAPSGKAAAGSAGAPARTVKPVPWTTVLIFLGSFLVIVAAAIFALVAWKLMGTPARLAFLGSLTAAFYVAGWWVRTKLDIPAGATALTVVASAMLLFDGWIVIDGFGLQGPVPWAVLLLVCSFAYWLTEILVAERFFGIIGAAAQLAWWWLLGQGLDVSPLARLAVMAVVVLIWRVVAERSPEDRRLGSLAQVLAVAAPLTAVALGVSFFFELVSIEPVGWPEVAYAGTLAVAAFLTFRESPLLHATRGVERPDLWFGALLQTPLLISLAIADVGRGSWALVVVTFLVALAYAAHGLLEGGTPSVVFAVMAEFVAVATLLEVLDAEGQVAVVAFAALAAAWALAARLADTLRSRWLEDAGMARRSKELGLVAYAGSLILLTGCSLVTLVQWLDASGAPSSMEPRDAAAILGVFAAWLVVFAARPRREALAGATAFSLWAASAIALWLIPAESYAWRALLPVIMAALWLLPLKRIERSFSGLFATAMLWFLHGAVVAFSLAGILAESVAAESVYVPPVAALSAVVAAVFLAESWYRRSVPSAVTAAAFSLFALHSTVGAAGGSRPIAATAAALGAAIFSALVTLRLRDDERRFEAAAVTSALIGTAIALAAWDSAGWLSVAMLLASIAWLLNAEAFEPWFSVPAGVVAMGSIAALAASLPSTVLVSTGSWSTVVLVSAGSLALGATVFSASLGPSGSRDRMGAGLSAAGLAALIALVVFVTLYPGELARWVDFGPHHVAAVLAVLGVGTLIQAARRSLEYAAHAGWFFLLTALWTEFGTVTAADGEWYTTSLAAYLVIVGVIDRRAGAGRRLTPLLDAAAVVVGLGMPLLWGLTSTGAEASVHAMWVTGLSLLAIVAGIVLKVRWYFFGGAAAIAAVALYRSMDLFAEYWWAVLGVIGVVMLLAALTWEQQRETRGRLLASFEGWR